MDTFQLLLSVFIKILFVFVLLILISATVGRSLGIRRSFLAVLRKVFAWGGKRIEQAKRAESEEEESEYSSSDDEAAEEADTGAGKQEVVQSPRTIIRRKESRFIEREATERIVAKIKSPKEAEDQENRVFTLVDDTLDFIKSGVETIIEDDVTKRFRAARLASWNLLTRTSYGYHFIGWKLTFLWVTGFFLRYVVLFPMRLLLMAIGLIYLVVCTAVIGYLPDSKTKIWLNSHVSLMCYRVLSRACSACITFYNRENMAVNGGLCVANHTSPIDVVILSCDNCYALVGQRHGGVLGIIQRALSRASAHVWFERSQASDREAVVQRLREHVQDPSKLPILIFPEGTCINNTSVMMFKKGSFEASDVIYPVAVKYDPLFGDPFWNSSLQSWVEYMLMMMTSWAIVCQVWYLPPMRRQPDEDAIHFANRVKKAIAEAGGLVDLDWDGQLKRFPVPVKLKNQLKGRYSKRLELKEQ